MGGGGLDLDDLDAALDGLSSPAAPLGQPEEPGAEPDGSAGEAPPSDGTLSRGGPPPLTPPPVRPKRPLPKESPGAMPSQWSGRTSFDDLFVADAAPLPSARGGLEEKVEYFREKLKRSEALTARFRDAWQTREREMDVVEALLEQEKGHTEDANGQIGELTQKLHALEGFIDQKKREFEAYGQKVSQAFQQKDEQERELRAELDRAAETTAAAVAEKDNELLMLRTELEGVQGELEQERRIHQEDSESLNGQLTEQGERLNETEQRLVEATQDLEVARQEVIDTRDAFERDLGLRNEAIEKLKSTVETQRGAIAERDEQLESLSGQLSEASEESMRNRMELETKVAELGQELDIMRQQSAEETAVLREQLEEEKLALQDQAARDVGVRDEAIAKLKEAIERQRTAIGERDENVATFEAKVAELETHIGELQTQISELESKINELNDVIAGKDAELTELLDARDQAARDIELRDQAIEKLKAAVESQKQMLSEREEQLSSVSEELTRTSQDSTTRVAQLEGEVGDLQQTVEQRETELQSTRGDLEATRGELATTQDELATRTQELAEAREALTNLEANLNEASQTLGHDVAVRDEAIGKLKAAIETQKGRIENLESEIAARDAQLADLDAGHRTEQQRTGEILARTLKALEVAQKLLS